MEYLTVLKISMFNTKTAASFEFQKLRKIVMVEYLQRLFPMSVHFLFILTLQKYFMNLLINPFYFTNDFDQ